ncbi:methyltransferase-like protein 23 [Branchiostoma floridae]|uniref:Methyltransferase-like protein 23 n=1 Tax=Branchiostoma floridae TaxID=7739 RepID=A0A9J7N5Q4_BRAFL|nr:methyltransferase-like protein 23 [Branchiostoma floridae]
MQCRFKTFRFERKDNKEPVEVKTPEVLDPSYGMYTWPCAVVLAQFVWHNRSQVAGRHVLELGAGTSLPGILAAKCGAIVTLTDSCHLPRCLENCRRSCEVNDMSGVKVLGVTWGQVSPAMLTLPPVDIILGSDCFYDPKDFEDVLATVYFFLQKNPQAKFWTTYQERCSDWSIESLLKRWKLTCVHIPLALFGADSPSLGGSDLPGNHTIQMLQITSTCS